MAILALGISHRRATVGLLERLAFADEDLVKAYRRTGDDAAIDEAVIVSTCNRVEIYGSVPSYHAGFQALKRVLCESRGVAPEDLAEPLYSHYESDAAEHLFTVASGLDSMVLGEPQILSQVRDALRRADGEGAPGPSLAAAFNAAVNTGRRVRSETRVGAAPDVFVAAGADLGAEALGGLEGRHAVVIGAGHMSALAVKHLRQRGVATVRVLNRSLERARALAERTLAEPGDLEELPGTLAEADIAISATGAAGVVAHRGAGARRDRREGAAAVRARPRGPARRRAHRRPRPRRHPRRHRRPPRVGLGPGRRDRGRHRARARDRRWTRSGGSRSAVAPNVSARSSARSANAATRPSTPSSNASAPSSRTSSPQEREAVTALARGVVAKLLHEPIVRLKETPGTGTQDAYARALAELFGLELPTE